MTVVLVHGNPETPAVWSLLADRLDEAGVTDVVRLAPPGFGAPLPAGFAPAPETYRDWLVAQLEGIEGQVDLIGHDWGGVHVAGVAMHRPDLVRSWASDALGLLHPDYRWHPLARTWQAAGDGEAWIAEQLALSADDRAHWLTERGIDPAVARCLAAGFDDTMGSAILDLYRAAAQPVMARLGENLERAAARPGLAIIATADNMVGTDAQRRSAADRAGAAVRTVDAGHWWMTERGGRPGAETLRAFWASVA